MTDPRPLNKCSSRCSDSALLERPSFCAGRYSTCWGFYIWKIVPDLSVFGLFQEEGLRLVGLTVQDLAPLGSEFRVCKHLVTLGEMLAYP